MEGFLSPSYVQPSRHLFYKPVCIQPPYAIELTIKNQLQRSWITHGHQLSLIWLIHFFISVQVFSIYIIDQSLANRVLHPQSIFIPRPDFVNDMSLEFTKNHWRPLCFTTKFKKFCTSCNAAFHHYDTTISMLNDDIRTIFDLIVRKEQRTVNIQRTSGS